jgi:hypothetical protein
MIVARLEDPHQLSTRKQNYGHAATPRLAIIKYRPLDLITAGRAVITGWRDPRPTESAGESSRPSNEISRIGSCDFLPAEPDGPHEFTRGFPGAPVQTSLSTGAVSTRRLFPCSGRLDTPLTGSPTFIPAYYELILKAHTPRIII